MNSSALDITRSPNSVLRFGACESLVASIPPSFSPAGKVPEQKCGGQTFPKSARLLKHADFERVYKIGRRHFSANMTVFYLRRTSKINEPTQELNGESLLSSAAEENPAGARIGITVSRALGGAVIRNRIKRRIREAARQHRQIVEAPLDIVINPKKSVLKADFDALTLEMQQAFEVVQGIRPNPKREIL